MPSNQFLETLGFRARLFSGCPSHLMENCFRPIILFSRLLSGCPSHLMKQSFHSSEMLYGERRKTSTKKTGNHSGMPVSNVSCTVTYLSTNQATISYTLHPQHVACPGPAESNLLTPCPTHCNPPILALTPDLASRFSNLDKQGTHHDSNCRQHQRQDGRHPPVRRPLENSPAKGIPCVLRLVP
jgi:hypothetical protein